MDGVVAVDNVDDVEVDDVEDLIRQILLLSIMSMMFVIDVNKVDENVVYFDNGNEQDRYEIGLGEYCCS